MDLVRMKAPQHYNLCYNVRKEEVKPKKLCLLYFPQQLPVPTTMFYLMPSTYPRNYFNLEMYAYIVSLFIA